MDKLKILLWLTSFVLYPHLNSVAQPIAINRVINKDLAVKQGDVLKFVGEKATIKVTGWNKEQVKLKLTFSASNTDKEIASKEIDYMQYAITREKNTIEIRNGFILPPTTNRILSRLEVFIEAMVPEKAAIMIINKYGDATIENYNGNLEASLEFSDLDLNNLQGSVKLKCMYSEIHGLSINTTSFISHDQKSKLFLDIRNGTADFHSQHSSLDITVANIQSLSIDAARTDISIHADNTSAYDYNLLTREGKLYLPDSYAQRVQRNGKQSTLQTTSKPEKPLIKVTTTFNTLMIK